MLVYTPPPHPQEDDPFAKAYRQLLKKRRNFHNRIYPAALLGVISYFLLTLLLSSFGVYLKGIAGVTTIVLTIVAIRLGRGASKYALSSEELGFLRIQQARKDLEEYMKDPSKTSRLSKARNHVNRALFALPTGRSSSLLTTRALRGTGELRTFIKTKLIPYLKNPEEPMKVMNSLGYLAMFLLDPKMENLPTTLEQLNRQLPEVPPEGGLGYMKQKFLMLIRESSISLSPFYAAMLVAFASSAMVMVVSVALGAPLYEGFGFAALFFAGILFGSYYKFKE